MERYWCLRWLAQQNARQVEAVVLKEEVLRLTEIPLVIKLPGMPQVARGAQVKLDLLRWDEVDLTVEARVVDIVQQADAASVEALDDEIQDEETLPGDTAPADAATGPSENPATEAAANS
jgi:exoribonuclease-2